MNTEAHPSKRCGPIDLRPDDTTVIMAWRGELTEGLFCPPLHKPFFTHDADVIRQFSGPDQRVAWTVRAPKGDGYKVSIICTGDNDILDDCDVELQTHGIWGVPFSSSSVSVALNHFR